MQLDLRQLQLKMDGLTRLRPLPDASLVETYIKAYYLPESSLDEWVRQHTVHLLFIIHISVSNFTNFTFDKNANLIVNRILYFKLYTFTCWISWLLFNSIKYWKIQILP